MNSFNAWKYYGVRNPESIGLNIETEIHFFFLHAAAISRRQRNKIHCLKLQNGKWSMDYLGIKHDIVGFYQKLYSSSQPDVDDIFSLVEPKVTPLMADSLNKPISREEV